MTRKSFVFHTKQVLTFPRDLPFAEYDGIAPSKKQVLTYSGACSPASNGSAPDVVFRLIAAFTSTTISSSAASTACLVLSVALASKS